MTGLDYFTFVVLAILVAAGLVAAFVLGELPGCVAADRGHPQVDAIRVAGWIGILTLGLFWPLALVWAFTRPAATGNDNALRPEIDRVAQRVATLEANDVGASGDGGGNA